MGLDVRPGNGSLYDIKIWQMFRGRLGLLGFTSPEGGLSFFP